MKMDNLTLQKLVLPSIPPRLLQRLLQEGSVRIFEEGTVILEEGSHIRFVPIVLKGSIKVMRQEEDDKEILLYYIQPGESCILSFLASNCPGKSLVKAEAEERCETLLIPLDKVRTWSREFPEWMTYIFTLYQKRFEELLAVINVIAFKKIDQRILDYLYKKIAITGGRGVKTYTSHIRK